MKKGPGCGPEASAKQLDSQRHGALLEEGHRPVEVAPLVGVEVAPLVGVDLRNVQRWERTAPKRIGWIVSSP